MFGKGMYRGEFGSMILAFARIILRYFPRPLWERIKVRGTVKKIPSLCKRDDRLHFGPG